MNFLIIPGLGNSSPQHWQSLWEKQFPDRFRRIKQFEWDSPICDDWVVKIEKEVQKEKIGNVVLIAHSLGCITVAHWAKKYDTQIKGAFLVAPSDCESPNYTFDTKGFAPIPLEKLPFKSLVVGSTNDEYVSIERAEQFADAWGSEFINVGEKGHINANSGFGEWAEGLKLLQKFD